MKKLFAFFILLGHMNFSMFIPQVDEIDIYTPTGESVDDINSIYEYLDQIAFGNQDRTPEDEDDDAGKLALILKLEPFVSPQLVTILQEPEFAPEQQILSAISSTAVPPSVFFEVLLPPPKC